VHAPLCVIVGAGPGAGLALAVRFGRERAYRLALVARNPTSLEELVGYLRAQDVVADGFPADAGDPHVLRGALEEIMATLGRPSALFYNAISENPTDAVDEFEVAVVGPMTTLRAIVPAMREGGGGTIVVTSCGAGSLSHSSLERLIETTARDPRTAPVRVILAQLVPRRPWQNASSRGWLAEEYWLLVHDPHEVSGKIVLTQ
jgi:NAD(P)-dependent dehydrogenase (short-subunit alcohol dehydrogenase family)